MNITFTVEQQYIDRSTGICNPVECAIKRAYPDFEPQAMPGSLFLVFKYNELVSRLGLPSADGKLTKPTGSRKNHRRPIGRV